MRLKEMEDLAAFSVREVKRVAAHKKKKRRVFICRRTVKAKAKSKVFPTSYLKIEGKVREKEMVSKIGK